MKQYRIRHIITGKSRTVNEEDYQFLRGKGWIGPVGKGKYVLEDVLITEVKSNSFRPPAEIQRLSGGAKEETQEGEKRKPGRPKKEVDANT